MRVEDAMLLAAGPLSVGPQLWAMMVSLLSGAELTIEPMAHVKAVLLEIPDVSDVRTYDAEAAPFAMVCASSSLCGPASAA